MVYPSLQLPVPATQLINFRKIFMVSNFFFQNIELLVDNFNVGYLLHIFQWFFTSTLLLCVSRMIWRMSIPYLSWIWHVCPKLRLPQACVYALTVRLLPSPHSPLAPSWFSPLAPKPFRIVFAARIQCQIVFTHFVLSQMGTSYIDV